MDPTAPYFVLMSLYPVGELGPMWWQLQSVVPPGLCRRVRWASREGGLCLHKLHTARLWQREMKTKRPLWRISSFCRGPQHLSASMNFVPCGFPFTSLVKMVLFTFFQSNKRLLSLFLSWWLGFFSQSTNLSETFLRPWCRYIKWQNVPRTNSAGIFQPKKIYLTSQF